MSQYNWYMLIKDRLIGIHHFLSDRAPENLPEVPPKPRKKIPWSEEGKPIVVKIKTGESIQFCFKKSLKFIGTQSILYFLLLGIIFMINIGVGI